MKKYSLSFAALALLLGIASATAADHDVTINITAAKVAKRADGRQRLETPRDAKPGDVVEYRITYHNKADTGVRHIVGTLSIPEDRLSYAPDSEVGTVEASIDGKTFAPVPLLRLVASEDGSTKMEPIPAKEYRFLRWQLGELPARGSVTVKARLQITEIPEVLVTNRQR